MDRHLVDAGTSRMARECECARVAAPGMPYHRAARHHGAWGFAHVPAKKMHDDEVTVDAPLVRQLLVSQFPHFAELNLHPVESTGTVNVIYRLGHDLCVRLPRISRWAHDLEKELEWLPRLAPRLPLAVPEPIARGEPERGYPFAWAIYRWIEGDTLTRDGIRDERRAAADLAAFVAE